jgi:thiamine-phosphate pyrophosphorylase
LSIIIITRPEFFDGEAERIVSLLSRGDVSLMHIRKPQASKAEVERLLQQIPPSLFGRLVLHDHHELAQQYHLHGVHLNSRNPEPPSGWQGAVSISCHSIAELAERRRSPFAYMSLSPIFDSISKQGYKAAFSEADLCEARQQGIIDERVMALGGVTFDKVEQVMSMGFGGAMILGDAWK